MDAVPERRMRFLHSGGIAERQAPLFLPPSSLTVTAPSLKPSSTKATISWNAFFRLRRIDVEETPSAPSAPRPKAISRRPPLIWSSMQILPQDAAGDERRDR